MASNITVYQSPAKQIANKIKAFYEGFMGGFKKTFVTFIWIGITFCIGFYAATIQSELNTCEEKLANALIPEATVGEAFNAHIVKPVANGANNVIEFFKGN